MSKTKIVLLTSRRLYNQTENVTKLMFEIMKENDRLLDQNLACLDRITNLEEELIRAKDDNYRLSEENFHLKEQICT